MQFTSGCMEHIHDHGHIHERHEPFAPAAENLLLDLALQANTGNLDVPDGADLDQLAKLEEQHNIKKIKARLGDAYPEVGIMGEAAVILAFAERADALPASHPRYNHSHGHEGDGCGKTHGPVRRTLDTIEQKVLGRIRNQRVKLVAAAAFRGSSLILCPGDDLAAIGLQLYGAFSGQASHDEHTHAEHKAVLPGRPRIDFGKGTAFISLPLDTPVTHAELPDTPAGRMVRERTHDPEPPQPKTDVVPQPERIRRRLRRLALVGAAAVAFVAGGFVVANAGDEAPQPVAKAPAVAPAVQSPEAPAPELQKPPKPHHMDEITAEHGDSQWELIEDKVRATLGRGGRTPLINALTHMGVYANKGTNINPGQKVKLPSREVVINMDRAVQNPQAADPRLVADVRILNSQNELGSPESSAAVQRMRTYGLGDT